MIIHTNISSCMYTRALLLCDVCACTLNVVYKIVVCGNDVRACMRMYTESCVRLWCESNVYAYQMLCVCVCVCVCVCKLNVAEEYDQSDVCACELYPFRFCSYTFSYFLWAFELYLNYS